MVMLSVPTRLEFECNHIRTLPAAEVQQLFTSTIPVSRLPLEFLDGLVESSQRTAVYRACLLAWTVTKTQQVPREHQLRAFLETHLGHDSMLDAGTGSGKTLAIVLPLLLDNPKDHLVSLTISPLKRLQISQENDFNARYHIPTVAINDDTPRDDVYWNEYIHDIKSRTPGTAQHIIATVEQLFKTPEGHYPRLAVLVRNKYFQQRIKRIHVDEAHFIHLAGLPRYGNTAFRPAWGLLDELKALLPSSISWQALSATFPPHILKTVESKVLRPNYVTIRLSSNRPNTIYATHRVSSIEDARNYECFLTKPFVFASQPRVLLFFDKKDLTTNISQHLDNLLPLELRGKGIVRHYHSGMSDAYLQQAHSSFTEDDGVCKILCATQGQSVGVDFPDVKIVCTAGLPSDVVEVLQRGGRVGRRDGDKGLFVVFYEDWALGIPLESFRFGDLEDPDRPRSLLGPKSNVQDRAAYSCVQLVQCKHCLRMFFASYLKDTSPTALDFETEYCCDRHDDAVFDLEDFLPSCLFTGSTTAAPTKRKKPTEYRKKHDRFELDARLIRWLNNATTNDLLNGVRSTYDILSLSQRRTLVRAPPKSILSPTTITELLSETQEWGSEWAGSLYELVVTYDRELSARIVKEKAALRASKKIKTTS